MDPTVTYVGSFDPSAVPFLGTDGDTFSSYNSRIGCIIDFGENYFGVATGPDNDPSSIALSFTPGFIQLWHITDTGVIYVNQFRIDVPTVPDESGGDPHPRRTCFMTHARLTATKAVCISYGQGGEYPYGYIVERVAETITFGPLFELIANSEGYFNNFNDPEFPPENTFPVATNASFTGSYLVLSVNETAFIVVGAVQSQTFDGQESIATRRFTVAGTTVTSDGSWHSNRATYDFFATNQYSWLYGVAVTDGYGYVIAWDWDWAWSLHKINLSTGRISRSKHITDPRPITS